MRPQARDPRPSLHPRPSVSRPLSMPSRQSHRCPRRLDLRWLTLPVAALAVFAVLSLVNGAASPPTPEPSSAAAAPEAGHGAAEREAGGRQRRRTAGTASRPTPVPTDAQLVAESTFSLALPAGWDRVKPAAGATFAAVSSDGTADATLWIQSDPKLDFATFEANSLAAARDARGQRPGRRAERRADGRVELDHPRAQGRARTGSPTYEVVLRGAGRQLVLPGDDLPGRRPGRRGRRRRSDPGLLPRPGRQGMIRRRIFGLALIALAVPFPALALDGGGVRAPGSRTLTVSASLDSCGLAGHADHVQDRRGLEQRSRAPRTTPSASRAPTARSSTMGETTGQGTSVWVPYVGSGTYSVSVTAWGTPPGEEDDGTPEVIARSSSESGELDRRAKTPPEQARLRRRTRRRGVASGDATSPSPSRRRDPTDEPPVCEEPSAKSRRPTTPPADAMPRARGRASAEARRRRSRGRGYDPGR